MTGVDFRMGDTEREMVNHPSHYNFGRVETIDYIEDVVGKEGLADFCIGNALKYISRAKYKGKYLEDLNKAIWYLTKAVQSEEGGDH